ncbi:MarR family transcriptional regulator [Verrucomicrobia bacterium IMCC26134]|nr:MarR family transcriptional regulator [Verrucomicrobia bacterium IMCC26134]
MPHLLLKDLPRYECLLEAAKQFPNLDPSACEVFLNLLRTGDEAFRVTDEHFQANGLSQGRFTVLMLLFDKACGQSHSCTPAELADRAGVTRATMTGLIDTLERDAMVLRKPSASDRRMLSVELTPRAMAFIAEILPEHFRRINDLVAPLSESERRTLVRLLGKVASRAVEVSPPQAAAVHA